MRTYINFLHSQSPQCEGDHGNRFVFREEVRPTSVEENSHPAGVVPRHVGTNIPDLLLHIDYERRTQNAISGLAEFHNAIPVDGARVIQVSDPYSTPPRFTLVCNDALSRFEIQDTEFQNKCGMSVLPATLNRRTSSAQFCKVFHAMSTYAYYLRHSEAKLDPNMSISLHKVERGAVHPDNLNVNGSINITQDRTASNFVLQIYNKTSHNLYPAVFYFDDCDLSISKRF